MSQRPTVCRTVLYRLSTADAERVNRRRVAKPHEPGWPAGAQAHAGNTATAGDELPLVISRVWPDEYGAGLDGVNGQVLLDGNDQLWVTSVREGTGEGTWSWPPRA